MKYFIRAVKYFFYLIIVLCLLILALVVSGFVEADLSTMFVNGYDSLWQIALIALFFAIVYPKLRFSSRPARMYGSAEELAPIVKEVFQERGYVLEKEDGENMSFRKNSWLERIVKMGEDRLVVEKTPMGYDIEGLTKDAVRIISVLEARVNKD